MLAIALAAAAFVAGLTGTWSPCGFSMIETIANPRRQVALSCATFAAGCCVGGVAMFGLLAWAGSHVGGPVVALAGALALAAAIAEARNAGVAPQIRRQVPERWRRVLPLPFAAGLYGILLGLGFTTFVLTFAVWAVAALSFGLGDPLAGVAAGAAFGLGRALPVVSIAPLLHRRIGAAALTAMAERPALLRRTRLADAGALALVVAALLAGNARGATNIGAGVDPSTAGDLLAWARADGTGLLFRDPGAPPLELPGRPALGGSLVAWRTGTDVHVARTADLSAVLDLSVPGVDALAVDDTWLVTRERSAGHDTIVARSLSTGEAHSVASAGAPSQLGRPSLDGNLVVYHVATRAGSRIVVADLVAGTKRVVRHSRRAQLTNPSTLDGQLLYVRQTNTGQFLELGRLVAGSSNRVLYRLGAPAPHDNGYESGHSRVTRTKKPPLAAGTLWTTALGPARAYVTFVPRRYGPPGASIVAVTR
ncbi:MAG TPA: hypothetical protein VF025_07895 [Gaiellaceae bacterium]